MRRTKQISIKRFFKLSVKDTFLTLIVLLVACLVCFFINIVNQRNEYVSMIFILAVFLVSRFTNGYLYGTVASFISVLAVNFFFTYPYCRFDFTISGYPLTIICMLAIAVITSALTTQIKQHSDIRIEAEREKTRSNLLRAVSHDLRTPLTSILGASSAIKENDEVLTKEERLKLLSEINDDAQWLIRMVENLLSITRIDGEHTAKIVKVPEAVEELVAESITKFKQRFPEQSVSVKVPDDLLMVPMDAMLIEQVIINLLENTVFHSKNATKIQLTVNTSDKYAVFEVDDNGCGIDDEVLPHIFEGCYKQESQKESDNRRNMGIGLSVCNTIVNAHNGTMAAENKSSGGAAFRFTLPLEDK